MKKINLFCPINGTGYGITSFNITKALHSIGLDLTLFPIGDQIGVNSDNDLKLIQSLIAKNSAFPYNAPCIKIWHQYDLASRIGNGHYYVFPFFEIDTLQKKEIHNINYADYIFVASHWAKTVLEDNGIVKPIYVAPLGVDTDIFKEPNRIRMEYDNYVFFHVGKWEHRKAHDILLQAFDRAFTQNDNVELRLLPYNPFLSEEETNYWFDLVDKCKLKNKIRIFGRLKTQYELAEFMFYGDCGVFVSRAEGWNNEIIESMAMNKPVIVTNYSAHTEYCNTNNAYLVNVQSTEPANDGKWFNGEGNWAKLAENELEQTVNHMRFVYKNHIDSNPPGVETARKYSWNNTANIIQYTLLKNNSYHANTKARKKRR